MDSRHPFAALCNAPRRGFTLLEILVVVVIIGVLAGAVVLAVDSGSARQLERESNRFSALLQQACEQAELGGRDIGVLMLDDGYGFASQVDGYWKPQPADGVLRQRHWIDGLNSEMTRDGRRIAFNEAEGREVLPQMICYSSGELTPFVLSLKLGEDEVRIEGKGDGTLAQAIVESSR
ncbi:MAG: type II secretion system minor pseudopilin GspH [Dokdonella sp.]